MSSHSELKVQYDVHRTERERGYKIQNVQVLRVLHTDDIIADKANCAKVRGDHNTRPRMVSVLLSGNDRLIGGKG